MSATRSETLREDSLATAEGYRFASGCLWSAGAPRSADTPVNSWRYRYIKRALDVVCSLIMIVVFAIPGLLIAAAIVLTSKGPVFYSEERIGRDGRSFRIWKFRSMHRNAAQHRHIASPKACKELPHWRMQKHLRDPRITKVGEFLRCWSLDELPQLFNVLRGEMSLIGPRPIVEVETTFYGDLLSYYLAATPGLSGLWQVSGRSHIDYDKRVRLDASYVRSWSLQTDVKILYRTVFVVLGRVGAR